MGPNDTKAIGTKCCVVEGSTYLASFLITASSVATAAVIDVNAE